MQNTFYIYVSLARITQYEELTVLVHICNVSASSDPPSGTTIQTVPPVVISQSVDLVCTATGDSPITFTWVLRGVETTHLNPNPASGNFTLTITQVNQYGVYICITTNNLGTDVASVDIIRKYQS